MPQLSTAQRRKKYLDEIADQALGRIDADDAEREARTRTEVDAARRREEDLVLLDELVAMRFEVLARIERDFGQAIAAVKELLQVAADERLVRGRLRTDQRNLIEDAVLRRTSGYMSNGLREVVGPVRGSFGFLKLPALFPMDGRTWCADESFRTSDKRPKEKHNAENSA